MHNADAEKHLKKQPKYKTSDTKQMLVTYKKTAISYIFVTQSHKDSNKV